MNFIKKNISNIVFIGFIIFLFTPYGLPVRAALIKVVSMVTTQIFSLEIDKSEREVLADYEWQLVTPEGERINLKTFKDEVVVINLWATWCPPCIAEMPGLQDLYNEYNTKVRFLFVANDEQPRVEKFMQDKAYTFPVYFQASRSPEQLNSTSLPTTYIIDRNGEIVVNKTGAADWNSAKVKNLLDDLLQ